MPKDICCGLPAMSRAPADPDEIGLEPYREVCLQTSSKADNQRGSGDTFMAVPYEDMQTASRNPSLQRSSYVWFGEKYNSVKQGLTHKTSQDNAPSLTLPNVSTSVRAQEWAKDLVVSFSSKSSEAEPAPNEHLLRRRMPSESQPPLRLQEPSIKASSSIYSQDVGSRPTSQHDLTTPFQPFTRSESAQVTEDADAITPLKPLYKDNRTPEQKAYDDLALLTPSNFRTREKRTSAPAASLYTQKYALDLVARPSFDGQQDSSPLDLPERSPARLSRHPSILDQQRWTPPEKSAVRAGSSQSNQCMFPTLSSPMSSRPTPGALRFIQEGRLLHEIAENDGVMQSLSRSSIAVGRQQRPEINELAIVARERVDARLRSELSDLQVRRRSIRAPETSSASSQGLRRSLSMILPTRAQQPSGVIDRSASTLNRKSRFHENGCTPDPVETRPLSKRLSTVSFTKAKTTLRRKSITFLNFMSKDPQTSPTVPQLDGSADHNDSCATLTSSDDGPKHIESARVMSDARNAAGVMDDAVRRNQEEKSALFLENNKEKAVLLGTRQRSSSFTRTLTTDLAHPAEQRSHSATLLPAPEFKTPQFASPRPRQPSESLDPVCLPPRTSVSTPSSLPPLPSLSSCQDAVEAECLGKWGSFPQHTKADRIGPARPQDGVWSRDFASEYFSRMAPIANKKRTSFRQNRKISKIRMAIKSYWNHITSPNIEYYKHGHGHRTSVSLGGRSERPELDLLP